MQYFCQSLAAVIELKKKQTYSGISAFNLFRLGWAQI